jgi:hypothetical protein
MSGVKNALSSSVLFCEMDAADSSKTELHTRAQTIDKMLDLMFSE